MAVWLHAPRHEIEMSGELQLSATLPQEKHYPLDKILEWAPDAGVKRKESLPCGELDTRPPVCNLATILTELQQIICTKKH
jgi:hypothetical protein